MKKLMANKGDTVSASQWNEVVNEVDRLSRLTVSPPLEMTDTATGPVIRYIDNAIWARLLPPSSSSSGSSSSSSSSGCALRGYAWQEVQPNGSGAWVVLAGGRHGTQTTNPAYEANGACMNANTVVRLTPGLNGEYVFTSCCSNTATFGNFPTPSSSSGAP